jgi:Flp pilus assembly pilin Flp
MPHTNKRPGTRPDEGATAVEYALLVSCIATVIVTAVTLLGAAVAGLFASVPPGV